MHYFFMALTLIFVTAKITGYIAWSWWIVFLPMVPSVIAWVVILMFINTVKRKIFNGY